MCLPTPRVSGSMITRFTAHGKTSRRSRFAESERFTALSNRCGCLRRLSFRSVDLIPSENLHRADAAIWIRLHAPMRIPRPNISPAERKNERCIRTGTVSFTCMRTIPRDDTVTSVRFYAARCRYWGHFQWYRDFRIVKNILRQGKSIDNKLLEVDTCIIFYGQRKF